MSEFDVVIATDLRFPGGSSGSTLEEINAQYEAGFRTGLYHMPASVLVNRRPFHAGILSALVAGKAELLNPELGGPNTPIHTNLLVVRHPSTINHREPHLPNIGADRVLLVVNHPPINSTGRIDYILPYAKASLERAYRVKVEVVPIGPLLRDAVEYYYGKNLLADYNWPNIFNLNRFAPKKRTGPRAPIVIGRHSRPGAEKWPDTKADLLRIYPESDDVKVRVLGGTDVPKRLIGHLPANWESLPFGAVAPEDFLRTLDVFVYYHHPAWVEAFGRVIAEAMATGLPVVVPPHFQPLFGDGAIYAAPEDVGETLGRLREPSFHARMAHAALECVRNNFSAGVHLERLAHFGVRPPVPRQLSPSEDRSP